MNQLTFKYRVATGHFLSHAGVIFLCLLLLVMKRISFQLAVPILTVVAPILAIYAPDIMRFVSEAMYEVAPGGKKVTKQYVRFSLILFLISHLLIYSTIIAYVFTPVMTPSQFQTAFGTIEVFFATYLGALMRSLYKQET